MAKLTIWFVSIVLFSTFFLSSTMADERMENAGDLDQRYTLINIVDAIISISGGKSVAFYATGRFFLQAIILCGAKCD